MVHREEMQSADSVRVPRETGVSGTGGRPREPAREVFRDLDGGLIAVNPTRYALQEAALLFPGRPLGLVLSIGVGRFANDGPDHFSDDIADQVKRAGGQYVRLDPIVDDMVSIFAHGYRVHTEFHSL